MKIKKDKKNIEREKATPASSSPMSDNLRLATHHLGAGRQFGLAIDGRRPIEFFIDDKKYHGFHGDTLAAALQANQQKFLAGSLLYHRPRGMLADKFYESNGFLAVGDNHRHGFEPAVAVATLPLSNGVKFYRTRHPDKFSSIQFFNKTKEALSALPAPIARPAYLSKNLSNKLAQVVGTGHDDASRDTPWRDASHRSLGLMNSFTGKTFATTSSSFWTGFLRQMMGYAPAPLVNPSFQFMGKDKANQVFYDNHNHQHDVVVVGGGGAAAVALQSLLARLGKTPATIAVISNESEAVTMAQMAAATALGKNINSIRLDSRVSWFFSTTAVMAKKLQPAAEDSKPTNNPANEAVVEILATQHHANHAEHQAGECLWQERHHVFHCRAIVLATGKSEQLLPFDNNDLPGVMGFGNAISSLTMYGVKPGHHAVVITNNDSVYHRLNDLHDAGVSVSAVIDIRKNIDPRLSAMANAVGAMVYEFYYPKRARALYNQSTPTIFPKTIGRVIKAIGRVVRTDNPGVASLLAVQQLDENLSVIAPAIAPTMATSKQAKKQKGAEEIYVPARASKIMLARPDQTDEAMSAETEKIFNSDCLLVSGGFQPRLSLFTQLLPKDKSESDYLGWSEDLQAYVPHHWPAQVFLIGSVGGCFEADDAASNKPSLKKSGQKPVIAMAQDVAKEVVDFLQGKKTAATPLSRHHHHHGFTIMPHRFLPDTQHLGRNSFIDHQYDVKLEHVHGSFAAGYHTPLGLKHYSKLGFGFDRGLGGLSLGMAHLYGNRAIAEPQANGSGAATRTTAQTIDNTTTMQNVIAHNNIFDELHGVAHPIAFGILAHLPLDGRQFFNQTAIKGEMPLYPLTHRPKFFNVVMHPENNLNNDHGAHTTLQDGKKIPNYYPYHEGDDEETAVLEEKQNIMSGIGFADGSSVTTINIVGKRAMDFLQFLSATKIANNKPGAAGGVTLLNPRDGLIIARGRYMVMATGDILLTLPLALPTMTEPGVDGQVATLLRHVATMNKFSVGLSTTANNGPRYAWSGAAWRCL